MANGQGEHVIEQHVMADGSEAFIEFVRTPVFDDDGNAIGIELTFWDVSVQKAAYQQSKQAEFLLDTMLENIPDSVYFKDERSQFIRVSDSQVRLFGLSSESELLGKTDADFFGKEHADRALADELESWKRAKRLLARLNAKPGTIKKIRGRRPRRCLCEMRRGIPSARLAFHAT